MTDDHRQAYLDHRRMLNEWELESSGRYDRGILTMTAGALALSLAFIDKLSPEGAVQGKICLGISWGLLIATLVLSLVSHLTSQSAVRRERDTLDSEHEGKGSDQKNPYSDATHWLNVASAIGFVGGVVFLCVFAYLNVK